MPTNCVRLFGEVFETAIDDIMRNDSVQKFLDKERAVENIPVFYHLSTRATDDILVVGFCVWCVVVPKVPC